MKNEEDNGLLPDALRWELRALRQDAEPARDLWPSIAGRLASTPQVKPAPVVARRPTWRRFAPLATAASLALALALGLAWQLRPVQAPAGLPAANDPHTQLIAKEADAMTLEYQAALKILGAGRPAQVQPASKELQVLDQSAAQIRTALTRDPNARFLLNQLQRTYTRRLELTQRLAAHDDVLAS
ncbi:hypothetical protein LVB87_13720 [Lysobacter sp. KIS68-7]|uniref:hypothetical protein n=1 Tax=Lysobacter sp. KIS68-7 TaxID=2904252 RepID=UPI001E5350A2|nr:hypothetical protein [Lysobacter sp. KIS68-7]UHQ19229.1 hypothetical protein LVB87_13720 [Lysobacter sp. KIS68-7]